MNWDYSENYDIIYTMRGRDYNLAEMLKQWQTNKTLTDHLRYFEPEMILYQQKKNNADKKGIEFSLDVSDIKLGSECPVTGECFEPYCLDDLWGTYYSPSIDKIDSSKGYIQNNIIVMRYDWNTFKFNATWKKLRGMVDSPILIKTHATRVFNAFRTQHGRLGVNSRDEFLEQLGGDKVNERLIRLLIVLEYELWLNGSIKKKQCKTVLEYEPEMFE